MLHIATGIPSHLTTFWVCIKQLTFIQKVEEMLFLTEGSS